MDKPRTIPLVRPAPCASIILHPTANTRSLSKLLHPSYDGELTETQRGQARRILKMARRSTLADQTVVTGLRRQR